MQKSKVALIRCDSYNQEDVTSAIEIAMELLEIEFRENEKILLKPNLLSAQTPEKAVTTHPCVFRAVAQLTKEQQPSVQLSYGDSAPKGTTEKILNTTGIGVVAEELNIPFISFEEKAVQSNPQGIKHKQFTVAKPVTQSDSIINIAKLKTHHLTRITAAVKNMFGTIPGLMKPEFHVKLPEVEAFSQMLVELNLFLKPKLHIIDAIVAMEGNGPNAGTPRNLNCIIVSRDPVAADSVACRLINVKADRVLTNLLGEKMNLGNMENIEILGDEIEDFIDKDFKVQRGLELSGNMAWKYRFLKNLFAIKPIINHHKCIRCGECINHCPVEPKALNWDKKNSFPDYDYSKCIRCYCCQEVCPKAAIETKTPLLRQIIDKVYS